MKANLISTLVCLIMGMPVLFAAEKAQPKESTVVIAGGVGINAEKALLSALRNAVQQVVGVVVDAETLIKNEKVVKDEILDFSNGFVEKFEKIREEKNDDGLYEVTIKATVKRRQLIERLQKAKVFSGKVDGASLFGSAVTEMEAREKGAKLLEKALIDLNLPYSLLDAEVVNSKPKIIDQTKTHISARWDIKIKVNLARYEKTVAPRLGQVLDEIAVIKEKTPLIHDPRRTVNEYDYIYFMREGFQMGKEFVLNPFCKYMEFTTFKVPVLSENNKKLAPVFLLTKREQSTSRQYYKLYWVDQKAAQVFHKYVTAFSPSADARDLQISLLNKDKKVLFGEVLAWDLPNSSRDGSRGVRTILRLTSFGKKRGIDFNNVEKMADDGSISIRPVRPAFIQMEGGGASLYKYKGNPKYYHFNINHYIGIQSGAARQTTRLLAEEFVFPWQPKIALDAIKEVTGIEVKIQPNKDR